MARITIADKDLFAVRHLLHDASVQILMSACPEAANGHEKVAQRVLKKLNAALKRIHGHDCCGHQYSGVPLKKLG